MDPITATVVYKLAVLVVGFGAVWCGYQLFRAGIFAACEDMDARFKSGRLVLKQAAPGIFFALFGTVILAYSIGKGFEVETTPAAAPPLTRAERNLELEIKMKVAEGEALSEEDRTRLAGFIGRLVDASAPSGRVGLPPSRRRRGKSRRASGWTAPGLLGASVAIALDLARPVCVRCIPARSAAFRASRAPRSSPALVRRSASRSKRSVALRFGHLGSQVAFLDSPV